MLKKKIQMDSEIGILEPVIEKYVFRMPLRGDNAREIYKEVKERIEKDFKNSPLFDAYFKFNEQTGEINGINTGYGILINDALSKDNLWLPSITQARKLDELKLLSNNVWRQYGMVIYDGNSPNKEVAERLLKEANKREWKTPILAPFKSLKFIKTGSKISFSEDFKEVITGEEAREYLDKYFDYVGNSGAQGLGRGRGGSWIANWYGLDGSDGYGRVDWICGEAQQKNLEDEVLGSIDDVAKKEVAKLNKKISSAKKAALKILQ